MHEAGIDRVVEEIRRLNGELHELSRKMNNVVREGRITQVFDDGTATVEAQGVETKRLPWVTRAGNVTDWDPPTEGERVVLLSPSGDPGRALILPGGFSEEFPQNHSSTSEARRTVGSTVITASGDSYIIETETLTLKATAIVVEADDITIKGNVAIEGESLTHNSKNIGDDHEHKDVTPGAANTGPPA